MAGRPPKSKKLHVMHGTDRADRMALREGELDLPAGPVGEPPDYLLGESLDEWNRLTKDPDYSKVISSAFRGVLIDYCVLHGEMVAEARGLDKMIVARRVLLHNLRTQLGITPASQSKVRAPNKEAPKSKWDKLG